MHYQLTPHTQYFLRTEHFKLTAEVDLWADFPESAS
ncbi:hypothetical protein SAMN05216178_1066 [Pseudomonas saponiphila]|uniref:Uncharacterized protein n=1 Tax=Pseudomonas saponiphila TaxID=556534 RepID=A0A1H4K5H3_9PSED|nr:hypothetical protein SAMN05216178_1066 [Pseudomonas saponiphila]